MGLGPTQWPQEWRSVLLSGLTCGAGPCSKPRPRGGGRPHPRPSPRAKARSHAFFHARQICGSRSHQAKAAEGSGAGRTSAMISWGACTGKFFRSAVTRSRSRCENSSPTSGRERTARAPGNTTRSTKS